MPRPLKPRRNLPGSRAVAGGLLVAAAAVGLYAAYAGAHHGPRHSYVVARRSIAAGTKIESADLALEAIDLPSGVSANAFDNVGVLVGATTVTKLEPGEMLQPSAVVAKAGDTQTRELSFPVERGHLSPSLEEGERVDLVATFGNGNDAFTTVVLRNAQVVSIDRGKSSLGDAGGAVIAVSVDDEADEVAAAHAIEQGKLTVVRATGAAPADGPPPAYRPSPPAAAFSDGAHKGSSP
jgi:hypothetical protein